MYICIYIYNLSKITKSSISPVSYDTTELHPLVIFIQGNTQKSEDLISHPQVESLLFLNKNNLIEMFFPRIVKEFDCSGSCSTTVGGVIGKTAENCSIVSIPTTEAFSDIITCWTKDNLVTYQRGNELPADLFRPSIDSTKEKPWTLSLHPVALFRIPSCIIKLKGYCVITGSTSKQSVRLSLQTYCCTAVDWLDVIATQKTNLKHLTYLSFDEKYYPEGFQKKFTKEKTYSVQLTFEIDKETAVYGSVNKDISSIKSKQLHDYQCSVVTQHSPNP